MIAEERGIDQASALTARERATRRSEILGPARRSLLVILAIAMAAFCITALPGWSGPGYVIGISALLVALKIAFDARPLWRELADGVVRTKVARLSGLGHRASDPPHRLLVENDAIFLEHVHLREPTLRGALAAGGWFQLVYFPASGRLLKVVPAAPPSDAE